MHGTIAMLVFWTALLTAAPGAGASGWEPSSPTATPTPTPLPGGPAGRGPCIGDCGGNNLVTVDEMVTGVGIALGLRPLQSCRRLDSNGDGMISINELIAAVSRLLFGCDFVPPTPTATRMVAESVCGGPITTAPKLCDLRIMPVRVRQGGTITISFGVSDLEGDLDTLCAGIGSAGAGTPALQCMSAEPAGMTINAAGDVGPIMVGLPLGRYVFALQARDRAGNASPVLTVEFEVIRIRL
jgi:hypothetical protein